MPEEDSTLDPPIIKEGDKVPFINIRPLPHRHQLNYESSEGDMQDCIESENHPD